ncbi:MAG: saccharopine dehydrogenase NADP-binding domain-containing protein [Pyrinomonadaceae bacterium]|nr:saccharopine dehydrogenase NADP-binding domain-containing protein [Pyrinomonadaceae bacterium]MCX7639248.1 saccharopine dehydrogenase NADP-binding domain-containing protein [Pyrinomonadaceae bacterium]MDW8303530.1 saccharopine dehydrogenase C-terminal domain-containing protein [Acidobacteriota bacterium]
MKVLVLGAGRMGYGVVYDLLKNSSVDSITIADLLIQKAEKVAGDFKVVKAERIDVSDYGETVRLMQKFDVAISCVDYWHNVQLSEAAIEAKTNFCDLGGNILVVEKQLALNDKAKQAGINIVPDCGLAPGMVSILAAHGAKRFDKVESIFIRVGGLPQNPKPPLDYQLTFSVEGLINEYVEPAMIIRDGKILKVDSMTEIESLSFNGFPPLEAFHTSGGASTLPRTFFGKVRNLDYKTIRYKGHCEKFKTMIELGLCSSETIEVGGKKFVPREIFTELLRRRLPADEPDVVLVRVDFVGEKPKKHFRYSIIDRFDPVSGLSAMMRMTAFPASIIAQMIARGDTSEKGAIPQEILIDSEKFIAELDRRGIKLRVEEV